MKHFLSLGDRALQFAKHAVILSLLATGAATPLAAQAPATLANISTRSSVQTGNNVLIGGFIVTGTQPKKVIVRALGPSLNVPGKLADPTLELVGPGGTITTNDNWRSTQEAVIIASGVPPTNDLESAIVVTLPANGTSYTVIERGAGNTIGVGQVEVYDLNLTVDSRLASVSSRGFVQSANDSIIGGIILVGTAPRRVLVRALGPSLPTAGSLADPTLEIRDANGMLEGMNDNWRSTQEAEIIATTLAPTNNLESAIVATLPASSGGTAHSAILRGNNGTTGIALVEIFPLAPAVNSAVSRKTHTGVGAFDVPLPLVGVSGAVGIEPRNGPAHQMVVTFSNPVTVGGATLTTGVGAASASAAGNSVTVNLTGVTDAQRIGVTLSNVNDGANVGSILVPMGVLNGDTTGNGTVSGSDVSQTKAAAATGVVSGSTFRSDVNANGVINSSDIALVKSKSGAVLPP